jgi:hypothetical protein
MSLYRVASPHSRLLGLGVPVVALAVGLVLGFLVGRLSAPEGSVAEALSGPAADVAEARNALDVLTIEYPQAVSDGAVQEVTEYEAARTDVQRAQDALASADDLEALDAEGFRQAADLLREVGALVERKASPAEVAAKVRDADEALAELPGARSGSG